MSVAKPMNVSFSAIFVSMSLLVKSGGVRNLCARCSVIVRGCALYLKAMTECNGCLEVVRAVS
jgi:hypothetical protein